MVSNATEVKKCQDEDTPLLKDIQVELGDCTTGPCELVRGKEYKFKQTFTAENDADNLSSEATGYIRGWHVAIRNAADPDVCKNLVDKNGKPGCPTKIGEKYTHERTFKVSEKEPDRTIDVQWRISSGKEKIT